MRLLPGRERSERLAELCEARQAGSLFCRSFDRPPGALPEGRGARRGADPRIRMFLHPCLVVERRYARPKGYTRGCIVNVPCALAERASLCLGDIRGFPLVTLMLRRGRNALYLRERSGS